MTRMLYCERWTIAHAMAATSEEARPWPWLSRTLSETMLAAGATPRYCTVALPPWSIGRDIAPLPAISPSTNVPWPPSSYMFRRWFTKSTQPTTRD